MYSAVFFGWPVTTIRPKRDTSTPTCSIEVASTASTGVRPRAGRALEPVGQRMVQRRFGLAAVLDRSASRTCAAIARRRAEVSSSGSKPTSSRLSTSLMSAEEIREVSSWMVSMPVRGHDPVGQALAPAVAAHPGGDVVVEVAAHAGQLAGGVEVADQGHVRVGGRAVPVEEGLPGDEQDLRQPDLGRLQPHPVRADAQVSPARACPG